MSLLDLMENSGTKSKIYGVVVGIVTNNKDEDGKLGRIKVKFPWLSGKDESNWVRVASPMAGEGRGIFFLPEVGDEVLLSFEHGDINRPYYIGSLWNGKDKPPETNSDGKNNLRLIKSRSGHVIKIDDTNGKEKIEIVDKTGNNLILIDSADNKISFKCDGDIEISATKGKIMLDAKKLELKSSASTKIEASSGMDLNAKDNLNIKGKTVNLN